MPSIGEVSVGLRADVAQFQAGMQQAAAATGQVTEQARRLTLTDKQLTAALAELRRDVSLMNAHLKSGVLDARSYAEAMALTRQRVLDLGDSIHRADAGGVRQFGQLLRDTAPAAEKAGLGLKSLRSPLATVAAQAVGASSSVGTLGSVLLSLGAGTGVTLGVLAGVAAIGAAMRAFKGDIDNARAAYDKMMERLRGEKSPLAIVGDQLESAREALRKMEADLNPAGGSRTGNPLTNRAAVEALRLEVQRLEAQYRLFFESIRTGSRQDAAKLDKQVREFRGQIHGAREAMDALNRSFDGWLQRQRDPVLFTISGVLGRQRRAPAPLPEGPSESDANALSSQLMKGLEPVLKAAEQRRRALIEAGRAIGDVIGDGISRGLARSLLNGVKDLGDVLKNVFRAALEELLAYLVKATILKAIANIIGAALGGAGGGFLGGVLSGLGGAIGLARGGGVVGAGASGLAGPALSRASITVPVSAIPRSPSPILQARDAQWQTLMGETLRVMEGLGYRFQFA